MGRSTRPAATTSPLDALDPSHSAALREELPGIEDAFKERGVSALLKSALFDGDDRRYACERWERAQAVYVPGDHCLVRYRTEVCDRTGAVVMPVAMNVVRGTAQLTQQATPAQIAQQATCQILNLTLAPLTLNLLGLVVEIPNPVVLNIFAVQGAGNLLGNLLCAITGLLDGTGPIGQLVAALNNLIGALSNL